MSQVEAFVKDLYRLYPLGHNISFDESFLKVTFDRHGRSSALRDTFAYHKVDTVTAALIYDLVNDGFGADSYKLQKVAERFGITANWHDAEADIDASIEVFKRIIKELRPKDESQPVDLFPAIPPPPPLPSAPREWRPREPGPGEGSKALVKTADGEWVWARGKHKTTRVIDTPDPTYFDWALDNIVELSPEQTAFLKECKKEAKYR